MIYYVIGISLLGQLALLFLQLYAYLRTRHQSFLVLSLSSVFGLIYIGAMFAQYFVAGLAEADWLSFWVSMGALTLQVAAGVWGAAWLYSVFMSRYRNK